MHFFMGFVPMGVLSKSVGVDCRYLIFVCAQEGRYDLYIGLIA